MTSLVSQKRSSSFLLSRVKPSGASAVHLGRDVTGSGHTEWKPRPHWCPFAEYPACLTADLLVRFPQTEIRTEMGRAQANHRKKTMHVHTCAAHDHVLSSRWRTGTGERGLGREGRGTSEDHTWDRPASPDPMHRRAPSRDALLSVSVCDTKARVSPFSTAPRSCRLAELL